MSTFSIRPSQASDVPSLFQIWEDAIAATHDFLAEGDREAIADLVRYQYLPAAPLWVAVDATDRPVGFMGMTGNKIDALFVAPGRFRHGIGRQFVAFAKVRFTTVEVDVNEQQAQARQFYESMGFVPYARQDTDDQGRPYPILKLRCQQEGTLP